MGLASVSSPAHFLPMRLVRIGLCGLVVALVSLARGQSTVPAVSQAIGAQTLAAGGSAVSFDLRTVFTLPGVTGQVVQFDTALGKFNVELRSDAAPRHVANFLNYVQAGYYSSSFLHRAAVFTSGVAIVQGGGYRYINEQASEVPKFAPIALEYNLPNARGTLAAARTSSVNSATSEWFFNVQDNSTTLGPANNSGYSVFGRVIGNGMTVVDAIAALPRTNAGGAFAELPVRNYAGGAISSANLVMIPTIVPVSIYPTGLGGTSVLAFTVESSSPTVATAVVSGSSIAITPRNAGSATITVRATDTQGATAENVFNVTVTNGPGFTAHPASQSVVAGGSITLTAGAAGASGFQWLRNGVAIAGATSASYTIANADPSHAGVYVALASDGTVTKPSEPAIVGIASTVKVLGAGSEVGTNIAHPNGNIYDQVLLNGTSATIRADAGQVVRTSYIDLSDDIVQVEFGGAGSLTITLDNASGPAAPVKYNQSVSYMKGHATIVLTGADATTNLAVFSVGRITAVNQALFIDGVTYNGMADIASIAIAGNGSFGALLTANTVYSGSRGYVGVYAPNVQLNDRLFVGDVSATETGSPTLVLAGVATPARITGGDILQGNARAIQITGLARLEMSAGTDSHGVQQVAQPSRGRVERAGVDVTAEVVIQPN